MHKKRNEGRAEGSAGRRFSSATASVLQLAELKDREGRAIELTVVGKDKSGVAYNLLPQPDPDCYGTRVSFIPCGKISLSDLLKCARMLHIKAMLNPAK